MNIIEKHNEMYVTLIFTGERDDGMSFTRHPQPLAAPLFDDVSFECTLNIPAESFAWHHRPLGARQWIPQAHPNISGKTSRHLVRFNDVSKAGDYRCIAFFGKSPRKNFVRCILFYFNVQRVPHIEALRTSVVNTSRVVFFRLSKRRVARFATCTEMDLLSVLSSGTSGFASDPARLTLATIQNFTDKSDVFIQVAEGNTVPITCPLPYSEPEPIVMFYKNNVLVKDAILINSKTMIIKNAKLTDSGSYHCSAENYIMTQTVVSNHKTILTVHANVSLQEPYLIKQPQTEYTVVREKNITLECFGAGYPVPRVSWSRLGSSLQMKLERSSIGLTIVSVQPFDRGEYDCLWSNSAGQIKSVIILRVMEPPKVTKQPKASTFYEGGELELSCAVTGEPEPTVEWLINGETLMPSKNQEIRGTTLFISEVEKRHAGIVQCVASNEYGSHSSGYNLLRVSPKQHVLGGTTESRPDYGMSMSRHKHTRGGGRRRNKEGKRKGTGNYLL